MLSIARILVKSDLRKCLRALIVGGSRIIPMKMMIFLMKNIVCHLGSDAIVQNIPSFWRHMCVFTIEITIPVNLLERQFFAKNWQKRESFFILSLSPSEDLSSTCFFCHLTTRPILTKNRVCNPSLPWWPVAPS